MKRISKIALTTFAIAVATKLVLNKKTKYIAVFKNGKLVFRNFPPRLTIKV